MKYTWNHHNSLKLNEKRVDVMESLKRWCYDLERITSWKNNKYIQNYGETWMPTLTWEAPNDKDDKVQIDIHKIQLFPVLFFFLWPGILRDCLEPYGLWAQNSTTYVMHCAGKHRSICLVIHSVLPVPDQSRCLRLVTWGLASRLLSWPGRTHKVSPAFS